jgi:hypothetical protein
MEALKQVGYIKFHSGGVQTAALYLNPQDASPWAVVFKARVLPTEEGVKDMLYVIGSLYKTGWVAANKAMGPDQFDTRAKVPKLVLLDGIGEKEVWNVDTLPALRKDCTAGDFPPEPMKYIFTAMGKPLFPEAEQNQLLRGDHLLVNLGARASMGWP